MNWTLHITAVLVATLGLACTSVTDTTGLEQDLHWEIPDLIPDHIGDFTSDAKLIPDIIIDDNTQPEIHTIDLSDSVSSEVLEADLVDVVPIPEIFETADEIDTSVSEVDTSVSEVDGGPDAPEALPYPEKTPYEIKGLQPDFWPDKDEIAGIGTGSVAVSLVWAHWEPAPESPPCSGGKVEYDGHCFNIESGVDNEIKQYSEKGVVVTGVVYGVPAWARQGIDCSPITEGFDIFCAPDNATDYGRFAGMLAQRYNGLNGNGRVVDFVIHNEVNTNDWFDIGCGQGKACNAQAWMETYADNYVAAYDAVIANQPHAKVLMSFTHHFDTVYDKPSQQNPTLSVKTFVTNVASQLGDREWRVAYHPYPPNLLKPEFSADDLPLVTYGNIGVIVGWLMAEFPNDPHAWDVQLTESGVNSLAPHSTSQAQVNGVCDSLYNVIGTPGISNYIYHRLKDHPVETAAGLGLGLRDTDGNPKPAWATWALSNRIDLNPPQLSCGFENLPYTRLVRAFKPGRGHWATTRKPPAGFTEEQVYALHYEEQPGTVMLYECMAGDDSFVSKQQSCEGQQPMGTLGYIHTEPVVGSVALYRCISGDNTAHMISPDPDCEAYSTEHLLGYALTL